ncbi:uncharacterized protein LOC125799310 [Astyanax mexicanus]|uniref:uncharacterized protein LOC125799310 n=1 Tax=Astyanax mexicanus TaxID=7994 RepID=UPI0020CACBC0|nr:uncharacterized protein LOC125799310 [Astyanax mexicanus]
MNSELAKATQSLTTSEGMRNQTKLVMQPYANWEEYLTPAPLSIAILGELVFISSKEDFSINKNPPKDGYKHIRYPDSFRACLMQVCNSGWWAFNEAHKNMDQIRLHTMTVPDYMKNAVKILFQGNDEVQLLLPIQLKNIQDIADKCLKLAESTEQRFTDVIRVIEEILEACINAQIFYGEELEKMKKTIKENEAREETEKKINEQMNAAVQDIEKELQEAQNNYTKALNSLPTGWKAEVADFAHAIINGVSTLFRGLSSQGENPQAKGQECAANMTDIIRIYCTSEEILTYADKIETYVQEDKIDWKNLYDQKNKESYSGYIEKQLCRIKDSLTKVPQCQPKDDAQKLCTEGINICTELAKYAPEEKREEAKTEELIESIRCFTKQARIFDSKSKDYTKSHPLSQQPPMMNTIHSNRTSWFRVEQTRAQMNKARENYEKSMENMRENQRDLTKILISMRNCELKEKDFNKTIKMLGKGMEAMGKVNQQWKKMVRFFQTVSNIVSCKLNKPLENFVSTAGTVQSFSYNSKLFTKDLLYTQVFEASNVASLVHMISATYTDVSEKYLMDSVGLLGTMLTMEKEKPEFKEKLQNLRDSCDQAEEHILELVLKNKAEFEEKVDARLEKIDKELLAILPKPAPQEMKRIQEDVESGFNEQVENQYC